MNFFSLTNLFTGECMGQKISDEYISLTTANGVTIEFDGHQGLYVKV